MTTTTSTHNTKFGALICTIDLANIEARLVACCPAPQNRAPTDDTPGASYSASGSNDDSGRPPQRGNSDDPDGSHTTSAHADIGEKQVTMTNPDVADASPSIPNPEGVGSYLDTIDLPDGTDLSRGTPESKWVIGKATTPTTTSDSPCAERSGESCVRSVRDQEAETSCIIQFPEQLPEIAAAIEASGKVALDIETYGEGKKDGLDPWKGDIRLLTLGVQGHPLWLLDLRSLGYQLDVLKRALRSAEVIVHNANFDLLWLAEKCGIRVPNIFCTLTAARLLSAGTRQGNDLDQCLQRHLGIPAGPDMSKSDWGSLLLTDEQIGYAARDVAHLHQLADRQRQLLEEAGLLKVCRLEMALLPVIIELELAGMGVDREKLTLLRDRSQKEAQDNAQVLRQLVNVPNLNPNSPKQLVAALEHAGLATGSTDEESLLKIKDDKIIPVILDFRRAEKSAQQATKLLEATARDGRVHGRFDSTGTMTGRFSSSRPNLQNIGKGPLRECFVPAKGHKLIVADYSQVELRLASVISGEDKMISAYQNGCDLHRQTAAAVLKKSIEEITAEDRQLAKAVNFGLLYGQGKDGLVRYAATNYEVTLTSGEAEIIRSRFFGAYPGLATWHQQCWRSAKQGSQEARTVLNRRRLTPPGATEWERFTALVNTPVQGGSADGLKRAMLRIHNTLPQGAWLICTVHDEVIVEAPEALAASVCELVRTTMRDEMAQLFPEVPIEVEARVCENWGQK